MNTGFNVIDFMDLPSTERCIVRLVLRQAPISYPQLRDAVSERVLDEGMLNAVLDHLTNTRWLVRQNRDQQVYYRVNPGEKTGSQNPDFWDTLDLDAMPTPLALGLQADPDNCALTVERSGKRRLPQQIWDCICDPEPGAPEAKRDTSSAVRRTGLFNSLIDD
jgi:hypothetical protein